MKISKVKQDYIRKYAFKKTNKEIASKLKINEKTMRNYRGKIFNYKVKKYRDFIRIKESIKPIKLKSYEWAYLSGLIDGEGCVGMHIQVQRQKSIYKDISVYLSVSNSNLSILKWVQKKFDRGTISKQTNKRENQKDTYIWRKNGFGILPILYGIKPYSKIKGKRILLVIKYLEKRLNNKWKQTYTKEMFEIQDKVRKLNLRGKQNGSQS